jgi:putative heme-binding domain-containing protein
MPFQFVDRRWIRFCSLVVAGFVSLCQIVSAEAPRPLKILLVTGGCCHDYTNQKELIKNGLETRAHLEVTHVQQGGDSRQSKIPLYENANWADGYDLVIHDECFGAVTDVEWCERILAPHKRGLPAVVVHCGVHAYRNDTDNWHEFVGVTSRKHGLLYPHEVFNNDADHPIMRKFGPAWANPAGELYWIEKVWPTAHPLASAKNRENGNEEVCAWTNDYHGARVFGTTLGHHNETIQSPEFLDLLTRGVLWASDKLDDAHLKPQVASAEHRSPETEKKLLGEFTAPQGYDATLFAVPPAALYPVYVSAAPDGVVYVSVDKNGSAQREPNRGAVHRLRDVDGDGRADETRLFVANVDSPRGLVWDRDRLYLMHPPHLSAYIDTDGDGRADREEVLVKDIAFGFKDRPADHTSNGVTLGIDGWLYLAIGDFGFMEAEGTDGRKVQFRGGGVVRVRTDGTGLEIYSRGTRNILEVAVDPLLNGFTRDNTNDGGGWDIRLHHFSGLEDHGYPRLFKNFSEEMIQPLADYGGGSGCGALFLDEPGFPAGASPAIYTADWGRNLIFSHRLMPNGATFSADQQEFMRIDRTTDLDVDANSHLYATSWHGAVFSYVGEDVGFLLRVTPQGYSPEPLPDFAKVSPTELIGLLESASHRRRLAAQRELLARGLSSSTVDALRGLAANASLALPSRVAALLTLKQGLGAASHALLAELSHDAALRPFAIRGLADREDQLSGLPIEPLLAGLTDQDPRTRLEAAVALARLGEVKYAPAIVPLLADSDPVIAHTAVQSLTRLRAVEACLAVIDRTDAPLNLRIAALRALQGMHEAAAVDGLTVRLEKESDTPRRRQLLSALARLYNVEGAWNGASWGTRPDSTGPYFQPEPWAKSSKIAATLKQALDRATGDEPAWILAELQRNRVQLDDTLDRLLAIVVNDPALIPSVVAQVKRLPKPPVAAMAILKAAAVAPETDAVTRAMAAVVLLRADDVDAFPAVIDAIGRLQHVGADLLEVHELRDAFMTPSSLGPHVEAITALAKKLDGMTSLWAEAGLLALISDKETSPEARAIAIASIEEGWNEAPRRGQILTAALLIGDRSYSDKALAAIDDPDPKVVEAARNIVNRWKLGEGPAPTGPKLQTMKPEQVVAEIMRRPGEVARGEALFTRLNCGKCHTVKPNEALRGPFLPQVAKTYKREQLAESVLLPNKSIAQGFVTYLFVLDSGKTLTGFVSNEAADEITIRDAEGRETKIAVAEIEERKKQEISIMPEGLVKDLTVDDFASLISYLESLSSQAGQPGK